MIPFTKECTICGGHFLLEDLAKQKKCSFGRTSICKVCKSKLSRDWAKNNPEKKNRKERITYKKRASKDPLFRMMKSHRTRLRQFFRKNNYDKNSSTTKLLGCSPEQLRNHLRSLYQPGMSDDNYGEWHIDHIIPLSSAQSKKELEKLSHYTNLQPLWAIDNLQKRDSILP